MLTDQLFGHSLMSCYYLMLLGGSATELDSRYISDDVAGPLGGNGDRVAELNAMVCIVSLSTIITINAALFHNYFIFSFFHF